MMVEGLGNDYFLVSGSAKWPKPRKRFIRKRLINIVKSENKYPFSANRRTCFLRISNFTFAYRRPRYP